jgi:hypothetical protein
MSTRPKPLLFPQNGLYTHFIPQLATIRSGFGRGQRPAEEKTSIFSSLERFGNWDAGQQWLEELVYKTDY